MTPQQWKFVEDRLMPPYGQVHLLIDDYKVTLQVGFVGKMKFEIMVYVNGFAKGEWLMNDCEERRRFLRPRRIAIHKPSSRARLTKGLSAKMDKEYFPTLNKTFIVYDLLWPSYGPLKRHLIKHNQSIELVDV